jgi:hypothetical protein
MLLERSHRYRFVFLLLAVPPGLVVGQTAATNVQLSASETRVMAIPARSPDTRATYDLENSRGQSSFIVSSSDPASTITLMAADGTEITQQNASSKGYAFDVLPPNSVTDSVIYTSLFPKLLNVEITLPQHASGTVQLKVNNSAVATNSGLLVTYYPESSIRVGLTPNKPAFVSGETVALSLLIFDGPLPVTSSQAHLHIQSSADPNAAIYSAECNDSGPLDAAPGDGIFTCTIDGLPDGSYLAAARVTGPGGIVRTTSSAFRVTPGYGSILGSSDEGVDRNHNGLIEAVRLNISLNITVPGEYRLLVRLLSSKGSEVQQAVQGGLIEGTELLSVDFPARLISALGVDGAYTIENCTLLFEGAQADDVAASRQDLGKTKAYLLSELELGARPPVVGDLNGDGVVDCADIGLVRSSFGKRAGEAGFSSKADVNGDGVVDVRDLAVVSRQLSADTHCGN